MLERSARACVGFAAPVCPYRTPAVGMSPSHLRRFWAACCTTALQPLYALIERHVLAAERLHGDDTTVPGM
jgi:Transposase IS66 family